MASTSVGNDVIDLGDPEARPDGCHARFDSRVFALSELEALAASAVPVRLRWILWAAKEATYKVVKKQDRATVFSPRRFVVTLLGGTQARVVFDEQSFAVELDVGERYVHAVTTVPDLAPRVVVTAVERLAWGSTTCPGSAVRTLAIATLAPRLGIAVAELSVARDGRIPHLQRAGVALATDLSLSHHGRFVAFACVLPPATDELRGAA